MVSRDTRSSTEYYINKNVEKKAKKPLEEPLKEPLEEPLAKKPLAKKPLENPVPVITVAVAAKRLADLVGGSLTDDGTEIIL